MNQPTAAPKIVTPTESPSVLGEEVNNADQDHAALKTSHAGIGQPSQTHPRSHLLSHTLEDALDEIRVMIQLEGTHYPPPQRYVVAKTCSQGNGVTEGWRRRLCEWMYDVVDHFGFDREAVSVAFAFLDRSVALTHLPDTSKSLTKREYQLSAVTSLYLALKVHGEMDPEVGGRMKLKISAFEELSRGFFKAAIIEAKELQMLTLFKWRVNPPTCAQFVSHLCRLLPQWDPSQVKYEGFPSYEDMAGKIYDTAKYLTELSLFVSRFAFRYTPSLISYGAVLCALEHLEGTSPLPTNIKVRFLHNMRNVFEAFDDADSSQELQRVQRLIRKLAPSMFSKDIPPPERPLRRSVTVVDLDTANSVAARSARLLSPTDVSSAGSSEQQELPAAKRRKMCK